VGMIHQSMEIQVARQVGVPSRHLQVSSANVHSTFASPLLTFSFKLCSKLQESSLSMFIQLGCVIWIRLLPNKLVDAQSMQSRYNYILGENETL
jgi:hypothetical protein